MNGELHLITSAYLHRHRRPGRFEQVLPRGTADLVRTVSGLGNCMSGYCELRAVVAAGAAEDEEAPAFQRPVRRVPVGRRSQQGVG